mgnify:FL=1
METNNLKVIDYLYKRYLKDYESDHSLGLNLCVQRVDGKSSYKRMTIEQLEAMFSHEFNRKWFKHLGLTPDMLTEIKENNILNLTNLNSIYIINKIPNYLLKIITPNLDDEQD